METPTIRTLGHGRASRVPDLATIRLGVQSGQSTASLAHAANAEAMRGVVEAIRSLGIADDDIRTANISLGPTWDHPADGIPRIVGYQATNQLQVTLRRLDQVAAVIDGAVTAGATTVDSIDFGTTARLAGEASTEALAAAVADARARADALAAEAGLVVGGVRSIEEWTSAEPPRPMFARMAMEAADTPVMPGTSDVEATVRVTFDAGPPSS
jgi:uncharacterized protein YggE